MNRDFYSGETKCQNVKCINRAYYKVNDQYLCGVHSRKFSNIRVDLVIDPNHNETLKNNRLNHKIECDTIAKSNKENGILGKVICRKMYMLKTPELIKGYVNIFPNYKHGNRTDGIGLPSLSPKSMGPIDHGQIGLPIAKNLENFHQGNKVFPAEIDENGEPIPQFYMTQKLMYNDSTPHRHKLTSAKKNVPLYSLWIDHNGITHKIDYITSRQFYCNYYERFTINNPDYIKLRNMIKDGYNLCICGYDAYQPEQSLETHYLDASRPFGHELVLYTMLVMENSSDYPWRKYKTFDF